MIKAIKAAFEALMNFLASLADYVVEKFKEAADWFFEFLVPFLKDVVAWLWEKLLEFGTSQVNIGLEAFDQLGAAGAYMATITGHANTFFDVALVTGFLVLFIAWEIVIVGIKIALKLFPAVY